MIELRETLPFVTLLIQKALALFWKQSLSDELNSFHPACDG
jgi:hypothetical protein